MKGFNILNPSQGEYLKTEAQSPYNGLLATSDNSAGDALDLALQNRRQKLAMGKIGLSPDPSEKDIQ